jgi:CRISPR system Cascade subunit CasB
MSVEGIVLGWWSRELVHREPGPVRRLSARLRLASPVEALAERPVQDLGQALGLRDGLRLARLACSLAEVREHSAERLARRLAEPVLSSLRFQRLLRADDAELPDVLRRAIVMADRCCDVAALGADVLHWGDNVKMRWCFDYYGVQAPNFSEAKE